MLSSCVAATAAMPPPPLAAAAWLRLAARARPGWWSNTPSNTPSAAAVAPLSTSAAAASVAGTATPKGELQVTVEPLSGPHEGVSMLTLNRPAARNALGRQLVRELAEALDTLRQERTTRCVLLRSAVPGCFSAGADLKERAGMTQQEAAEFVSTLRRLMCSVAGLPMPTIAVIEGHALGGGAELALACDLRVATRSASLAFPEARLGIIPGAGGTQRLPRIVGRAAAKELVFTARRVGGDDAAAMGLVDHCVDDGRAMPRALEIAADIAQCAPLSLRMAKAAINTGAEVDLSSGLAIEEACYAQLLPTRDRLEGLAAFAEKRAPCYTECNGAVQHFHNWRASHVGPHAAVRVYSTTSRGGMAQLNKLPQQQQQQGQAKQQQQNNDFQQQQQQQQQQRSTIFALSSGAPPCAVAVVRVSGPSADGVLHALWPALSEGKVPLPPPRVLTLAQLFVPEVAATTEQHPGSTEQPTTAPPAAAPRRVPLDTALVVRFPAGSSFTGEPSIELHLHGGTATVAAALSALASLPPALATRPAEPGEFARRAYEAGKLDLTEVEGLADLLAARSEAARRLAAAAAGGAARRAVTGWRAALQSAAARLEAVLDFGEDAELGASEARAASEALAAIASELEAHAAAYSRADLARAGLRVVIAGRPNSGKSSLLNALAGRGAAIVSPLPGTTRDVVEVPMTLAGHSVAVADSAGLRATECPIEAAGVARALEEARTAHLLLWVCDAAEAAAALDQNEARELWRQQGQQQQPLYQQRAQQQQQSQQQPQGSAWVDRVLQEATAAISSRLPVAPAAAPAPPPLVLVVLNKADLVPPHLLNRLVTEARFALSTSLHAASDTVTAPPPLPLGATLLDPVSSLTGEGLPQLQAAIEAAVGRVLGDGWDPRAAPAAPAPLATRLRHRDLVLLAAGHLRCAGVLSAATRGAGGEGSTDSSGSSNSGFGSGLASDPGFTSGEGLELAAEEVRLAEAALGALTGAPGARDVEGMLDRLFSEFCIGK